MPIRSSIPELTRISSTRSTLGLFSSILVIIYAYRQSFIYPPVSANIEVSDWKGVFGIVGPDKGVHYIGTQLHLWLFERIWVFERTHTTGGAIAK